ncbi:MULTISPECIES: hypothetical protein [unclassified Streptomyces]
MHPVVQPRVDYELTPLGRTLLDWALTHIDDIDKARDAYDTRT